MGLFDGISLPGIVRDVSNVVGAFTGARPVQPAQPAPINAPRPVEGGNLFDERVNFFGEILPNILQEIPRYVPPTQQEIILKLPEETKESGQMENGPQVYQGFTGALGPLATQAGRTIARTIFGGGAGGVAGTVGGALTGYGVGQMMAGDACGCPPKPFVRLDKCGRPIITRAMQAKAKDMVMCMGIEGAAAALGVSVPLLAEIAFKRFKPRAKGISGAQLKTATRVNNKIMHMAKKLEASCKRPPARRR
jgi:hypothetical protein